MVPLQLCLERSQGSEWERETVQALRLKSPNTYWSHRAQSLPCDLNILQLSKLLFKSCTWSVCLSHRPEVTQQSLRLKSLLLVLIIKVKDLNKPLSWSISSHSSNCVAYETYAKTWCQQLLCLHHAWFMNPSYSISFYIGFFFLYYTWTPPSFIHFPRSHSPQGALMAWWA